MGGVPVFYPHTPRLMLASAISSVISLSEEDRSKRSHGGCTVCCLNGDQRG